MRSCRFTFHNCSLILWINWIPRALEDANKLDLRFSWENSAFSIHFLECYIFCSFLLFQFTLQLTIQRVHSKIMMRTLRFVIHSVCWFFSGLNLLIKRLIEQDNSMSRKNVFTVRLRYSYVYILHIIFKGRSHGVIATEIFLIAANGLQRCTSQLNFWTKECIVYGRPWLFEFLCNNTKSACWQ